MLFTPGRCLQCIAPFKTSNGISPHYTELQLKLDDGMTIGVGLCAGCGLTEEEWPVVIEKLNQYYKLNGGPELKGKIVEEVGRKTYKDIIYAAQSGACLGCHQPIDGTFIITGGMMLHEGCNLPPPAPIEASVIFRRQRR